MREAGLDRADLYSVGSNKGRFGSHCFRRSMVTRNLALGMNEDTVRRRTGHRGDQILKYRQAAKALEELAMGDVWPLVFCIPELNPIPAFEALLRKLSAHPEKGPNPPDPHGKDRSRSRGRVGQRWARNGRGGRIRTDDPQTPSLMRYQAALRPETNPLRASMGSGECRGP